MSFADKYFSYYSSLPAHITHSVPSGLDMIVVIPCINEPDINKTLQSLLEADKPQGIIEVIIVVNSGERNTDELIYFNRKTYEELLLWSNKHSNERLIFHPLLFENLPRKHAGAGLARKIGMDEAVRRFNAIDNKNGIIISLDADTLVEKNYFVEIENSFSSSDVSLCNIHFEHPLSGNEFSNETYLYISKYELHLRYLRWAYKLSGFPYAYHTIGSAFALRAFLYVKQGGMNKRTAGEDFYFLHKLFPVTNIKELTTTKVIPSPRPSDRVPFGTGASMTQLLEGDTEEYYTYNPEVFYSLKTFFSQLPILFSEQNFHFITNTLHPSLIQYLDAEHWEERISEIKNNVTSLEAFQKRFFRWFDAFRIVRYINTAHIDYFDKVAVEDAACNILPDISENVCQSKDVLNLLGQYRKIDIKGSKYY